MLLGERSQTEKATRYVIPKRRHSEKGKITETVKRSVVARGYKGKGNGRNAGYFQGKELVCHDGDMPCACPSPQNVHQE